MFSLIQQQTADDKTLVTLLTEVERILDNRPWVPASFHIITRLIFTLNYLSALSFNSSFMELVNLCGICLHRSVTWIRYFQEGSLENICQIWKPYKNGYIAKCRLGQGRTVGRPRISPCRPEAVRRCGSDDPHFRRICKTGWRWKYKRNSDSLSALHKSLGRKGGSGRYKSLRKRMMSKFQGFRLDKLAVTYVYLCTFSPAAPSQLDSE